MVRRLILLFILALHATACDDEGGGSPADTGAGDTAGDTIAEADAAAGRELDGFTLRRHLAALTAVAFGAGRYVAVGSDGIIQGSADGEVWSIARPAMDLGPLHAVAFDGDTWVAVGELGRVLYSNDGQVWNEGDYERATPLQGVATDGTLFVAVGAAGAVATSSDGQTWTAASSGVDTNLFDVVSGNGLFVAVGAGGVVMTSEDGLQWQQRRALNGNEALEAVIHGNDAFLAVGTSAAGRLLARSEDGITWTSESEGGLGSYRGLVFGDGVYVAVGGDEVPLIATSPDGEEWTVRVLDDSRGLAGVTLGDNGFVAVGDGGLVATSTIGSTWLAATPNTGGTLLGAAGRGDAFVAVGPADGAPTILHAEDGTTWTAVLNDICQQTAAPGCAPPAPCECTGLAAVTSGPEGFVAVGPDTIAFSTTGFEWFHMDEPAQPLVDVAHGGGLYVAVGGSGLVATSTAAQAWTYTTVDPPADLSAVAHGNGRWVAIGEAGASYTSADGTAWTVEDDNITPELTALAYGAGLFVGLMPDRPSVFTSSAGTLWTEQPLDLDVATAIDLRDIAFADGLFVAVGQDGLVITSADGMAWGAVEAPVAVPLSAVAFGDSAVAIVGDEGFVMTSP